MSFVDIIERAYHMQANETDWLDGLCEAAEPRLDAGLGVMAWRVDVSDPASPWASDRPGRRGVPDGLDAAPQRSLNAAATRDQSYVTKPVATVRAEVERMGGADVWSQVMPAGVEDSLGISGFGPDGRGAVLCSLRPRKEHINDALSSADRHRWGLVAAHLASAARLRASSVNAHGPDAILTPDGRCVHAEASAQRRDCREALRSAAKAVDSARGRTRREDPDAALGLWQGLCDGQWSLVDRFESDGKRYVVAMKNDPVMGEPRSLEQRERQIVGYLSMGHSLSYIAYELGVSLSSVSKAVQMAMLRLGAESRHELALLVQAAHAASQDDTATDGPGERGRGDAERA